MQGLKCGILCEMLSTGLGFWAYEMGQGLFRDLHEGRSPSPRERGFIGGFSAMLVMSTTMPLETVLRRLQVSPVRLSMSYDTTPCSPRALCCLAPAHTHRPYVQVMQDCGGTSISPHGLVTALAC